MPNENSPNDVLKEHAGSGDLAGLQAQIAELQAKLAEYNPTTVVDGNFEGPKYLLNEPGYYEDTYFDAGSEIVFTGFPNLTMVPLNDSAKRKMDQHIEYLTGNQREAFEAAGRIFNGLVTDRGVLLAQSLHDVRAGKAPEVVIPVEKGAVPAMPHMDGVKHAKRAKSVLSSKAPPTPAKPGAPNIGPGTEPRIFGSMG